VGGISSFEGDFLNGLSFRGGDLLNGELKLLSKSLPGEELSLAEFYFEDY
jgi:hypothetical protein